MTAAEMEAMKEAAAAGGTGSVDGFGETYGEQVEREQDAIEAAAAAVKYWLCVILSAHKKDSVKRRSLKFVKILSYTIKPYRLNRRVPFSL